MTPKIANYHHINSINNMKPVDSGSKIVLVKFFSSDWSINTRKAYLADIQDFVDWIIQQGEKCFTFGRLVESLIIDYRDHLKNEKKLAPTTINRKITVLIQLCEAAKVHGFWNRNIAAGVKLLPVQALAPKNLEQSDLRRLRTEIELRGNIRDMLMFLMMSEAGFRVSELVNMKWEDIHFGDKKGYAVVRYGKGGKTRTVPLNKRIRACLRQYPDTAIQQKDYLFIGQRGNLTNIAFNKIIEKYSEKAGIKRGRCTPHTLRHCFSYNYLSRNPADIVGLSQILGHSNLNTTAIYTQRRLEDLQERVEF